MPKDYVLNLLEERQEELLAVKSELNKIFYPESVDLTKEKVSNKSHLTTDRLEKYIDKMDLLNKELSKLKKNISKRKSELRR